MIRPALRLRSPRLRADRGLAGSGRRRTATRSAHRAFGVPKTIRTGSEIGPRTVSSRATHRRERFAANPMVDAGKFPFRKRRPLAWRPSNHLAASGAELAGRSGEIRMPADQALRVALASFHGPVPGKSTKQGSRRFEDWPSARLSAPRSPNAGRNQPCAPWKTVQLGAGCRASALALPRKRPWSRMKPIRPCAKATLARPEGLRGGGKAVYDPSRIAAARI